MTALYSTTRGADVNGALGRSPLLTSRLWVAVFASLCLILVCLGGRDGLRNLYDRWRYEEEYGYGFFIILLSSAVVGAGAP